MFSSVFFFFVSSVITSELVLLLFYILLAPVSSEQRDADSSHMTPDTGGKQRGTLKPNQITHQLAHQELRRQ